MQSIQIQVFGKVQGVWFRKSTQLKAQEIGLSGTVENRPDGSVFIEAVGTEVQLKKLAAWCQEGPTHAVVERVEMTTVAVKDFVGFEVLR